MALSLGQPPDCIGILLVEGKGVGETRLRGLPVFLFRVKLASVQVFLELLFAGLVLGGLPRHGIGIIFRREATEAGTARAEAVVAHIGRSIRGANRIAVGIGS